MERIKESEKITPLRLAMRMKRVSASVDKKTGSLVMGGTLVGVMLISNSTSMFDGWMTVLKSGEGD